MTLLRNMILGTSWFLAFRLVPYNVYPLKQWSDIGIATVII